MATKDEQKESAKLAAETAQRWREHPRAELHAELDAEGSSKNPIELHAVGDTVVLNSHGERRLSRDDVVILRKKLEQAFQVVA